MCNSTRGPQGVQSPHAEFSFGLWRNIPVAAAQALSRVQLSVTPWTAARHASLSITSSQSFLRLMSVKLVMTAKHLILCRPLFLLPSIFWRNIRRRLSQRGWFKQGSTYLSHCYICSVKVSSSRNPKITRLPTWQRMQSIFKHGVAYA